MAIASASGITSAAPVGTLENTSRGIYLLRAAAHLRGPIGLLVLPVVFIVGNPVVAGYLIPLGALVVLAWALLSRTPWQAIGYAAPHSWLQALVAGIALGIALKFVMKAAVMPLLGAPPINVRYQYLAGNTDLIAPTLWTMVVIGFAEETFWRGFLFERLRRMFPATRQATTAILLLTSVLFGLAHYSNQGIPGVEQAIATGLVFGAAFVLTGNLWLSIIAHSAFDLTAYAMIYWGLEVRVSTLFFA
jgi:uncharacterized protein